MQNICVMFSKIHLFRSCLEFKYYLTPKAILQGILLWYHLLYSALLQILIHLFTSMLFNSLYIVYYSYSLYSILFLLFTGSAKRIQISDDFYINHFNNVEYINKYNHY